MMSNIKYEEMDFDDAQNEIDYVERPEDILVVLKVFFKNEAKSYKHLGYILIYQDGEMKQLNENQQEGIECIDLPQLIRIYTKNARHMAEFVKTVEIVPIYQHSNNITILFEQTRIDETLIQEELIGWYHGEPNDEDTKLYSTKYRGKYLAQYMTEEEALIEQ